MKNEFDVAVQEAPAQKTDFKENQQITEGQKPSQKHGFNFRCERTKAVETKMRYHP